MNKKIAIIISGEGSNLQAFIDAQQKNKLCGEIAVVISNRPQANGLNRAKKALIPSIVVDHKDFSERAQFDQALATIIDQYNPDLILLAGFMRILGANFVTKYQSKLVNIHPSLLPKFTGVNTHQRVLEANDTEHGCSVHFVTTKLDGGPVFGQTKLWVEANDTAASLATKVHRIEHKLYVKCANLILTGQINLNDNRVFYNNEPLDDYIKL